MILRQSGSLLHFWQAVTPYCVPMSRTVKYYAGKQKSNSQGRYKKKRNSPIYAARVRRRKANARKDVELSKKLENAFETPVKLMYEEPTLQSWVFNMYYQRLDIVPLNSKIWNSEIRKDIIHRCVQFTLKKFMLDRLPQKNRGEMPGGGRKPWPQKGTGRARHGSVRSPLFKKGGKAHGQGKCFTIDVPKQVRKMGVKIALTAKYQENNLSIIDTTELHSHKEEYLREVLKNWPLYHHEGELRTKVLVIHTAEELDPNLAIAAFNMPNFDFLEPHAVNTYDIVNKDRVIITRQALQDLERRLLKPRTYIHFDLPDKVPMPLHYEGFPENLRQHPIRGRDEQVPRSPYWKYKLAHIMKSERIPGESRKHRNNLYDTEEVENIRVPEELQKLKLTRLQRDWFKSRKL